jgi:hypothetical protein
MEGEDVRQKKSHPNRATVRPAPPHHLSQQENVESTTDEITYEEPLISYIIYEGWVRTDVN